MEEVRSSEKTWNFGLNFMTTSTSSYQIYNDNNLYFDALSSQLL